MQEQSVDWDILVPITRVSCIAVILENITFKNKQK